MAAEDSVSSVFDHLCENLQFVVDELKADTERPEAPHFVSETFWNRIGACVKLISQDATKLCLACSEPPLPSAAELHPLAEGIDRSTLALAAAYYSLPVSQGRVLRRKVTDSVISLFTALTALITSLKAVGKSSKSKRHLQSTGSIWEICDKFPSLPKDNKQAVIFNVKETLELVSDALDELEEAQKNGPDDFEDSFFSSSNSNDNIDAPLQSGWSDADHLVISACLGVIKTTKASLKKLCKAVEVKGRCDEAVAVGELDVLYDRVLTLSPAVDDLASSLYPPVRIDTVSARSQHLVSELRQLLICAENSHFTESADSSWLEFLNKAVDHNASKTSEIIASMH